MWLWKADTGHVNEGPPGPKHLNEKRNQWSAKHIRVPKITMKSLQKKNMWLKLWDEARHTSHWSSMLGRTFANKSGVRRSFHGSDGSEGRCFIFKPNCWERRYHIWEIIEYFSCSNKTTAHWFIYLFYLTVNSIKNNELLFYFHNKLYSLHKADFYKSLLPIFTQINILFLCAHFRGVTMDNSFLCFQFLHQAQLKHAIRSCWTQWEETTTSTSPQVKLLTNNEAVKGSNMQRPNDS